jgi:hypothetical protein
MSFKISVRKKIERIIDKALFAYTFIGFFDDPSKAVVFIRDAIAILISVTFEVAITVVVVIFFTVIRMSDFYRLISCIILIIVFPLASVLEISLP